MSELNNDYQEALHFCMGNTPEVIARNMETDMYRIRQLERELAEARVSDAESIAMYRRARGRAHSLQAELAAAYERAAKVCEGAMVCTDRPDAHWAELCAAAIRALASAPSAPPADAP